MDEIKPDTSFILKTDIFRIFVLIRMVSCLLLFSMTTVGQAPMKFNHLTKENGLPSNIIYCAVQDFQGYIWIGTTNGLARYDGHDMKVFRSIPGDSTSLVDNIIYCIFQASDSMIWMRFGMVAPPFSSLPRDARR